MQTDPRVSVPVPSGEPPRRRSMWPWVLGGCGGCALLMIVLLAIGGGMLAGWISDVARTTGPVDQAAVQKSLGADFPLYPAATLDVPSTQAALLPIRAAEKVAGKQPGAMFRGVALMRTRETPEKVLAYYDRELKQAGWSQVSSRGAASGGEPQRSYRKGREVAVVKAVSQSGETMVTLMRGGPELASRRGRRRSSAGASGAREAAPAAR